MPIEIECKARVASHSPLREKLRGGGARRLSSVLETNAIFDLPDGALRRAGRGLRIRSITAIEGEAHGPTLTYKGPRMEGPFKSRQEIEVTVGDAGATAGLLRALGYTEQIVFEKRRESWLLGPCRVELDELPRLGLFVEVEGPDEAAIRSALVALDLAEAVPISESYVSMVAELATSDAVRPVELRFEKTM